MDRGVGEKGLGKATVVEEERRVAYCDVRELPAAIGTLFVIIVCRLCESGRWQTRDLCGCPSVTEYFLLRGRLSAEFGRSGRVGKRGGNQPGRCMRFSFARTAFETDTGGQAWMLPFFDQAQPTSFCRMERTQWGRSGTPRLSVSK